MDSKSDRTWEVPMTAGRNVPGAAAARRDQLAENYQRLRAAFDQSPGFRALLAPDGTVTDVSARSLRTAGLASSDIVGRKLWEASFWPDDPDLRKEVEAAVRDAARGHASTGSWRYCVADGSQRCAERWLTPVTDSTGRVVSIVAEGRDITDRMQAEKALHESEQRLQMLVDYAPEAIVMLDVDQGRFVDANENAERLFGLRREQLLQMGPGETSPPEQPDGRSSADHIREKLESVLAGGKPMFEWWHRNSADEDFLCEIRLVQLPWTGRRVVCATLRDVTQQKRMQQIQQGRARVLERLARGASLDEVLTLLVQTVEQQSSGMIGSVLLLDRETQQLRHGVAPGLPDYYNQMVDGLRIGPDVGSCGAAAYTGQRVVVRDTLEHPNWAPYREMVERTGLRACWSEPILAADDSVLGTFAMYYREPREPSSDELKVIATAAQIAGIAIEHKRAEDALLELNRSLEQRVQERTSELGALNAELERSNRDLQQFAYAASHDLREPLRAVTGFSDLLQRRYVGRLDANADEFIQHIVDGAGRMQELLDGLLAYSRLGTGGGKITLVDADEALVEALGNLQTVIDDADAEITHRDLPALYVEHTQLVQLFQNLVSNAVKYRGTRRPQIAISAQLKNGDWQVDVKDNGIGIEAEYLESIFEIFDRLHTRDEYPGMGIGLALCKRIVERHGGRIWATSEPGVGSTFSFTLPAQVDVTLAPAS